MKIWSLPSEKVKFTTFFNHVGDHHMIGTQFNLLVVVVLVITIINTFFPATKNAMTV